MSPLATIKPLRRSERLQKAPPVREVPRREELLRLFTKYDVQAPRYTSYPPATQFHNRFDSSRYLDHIARTTAKDERPEISLYLHLPFCDTLCYFCGCTMMISNNREKIAEYVEYIKREIAMVRESFESEPTVVQMHWGGGSPTHLLPSEIADLGAYVRRTFRFANDAEVSIEIDPRGLTEQHVEAMRSVGFNRASIGVQDFSEDVQVAINRVQSRSMTEQVIDWCRSAGIASINLDLIYGLPYQTTRSFGATLETVRAISPERIAVYNFAYVPWIKPHQNLIPIETLPSSTNKLALLELAVSSLSTGDYEYLGMDHFVRPDDAMAKARRNGTLHRNFQGYSILAGKDLYGFGISSIGRIENAFAQNVKTLPEYYRMIDGGQLPIEKGYELNTDDSIREHVIMGLMCNMNISKDTVEDLFNIRFDRYFKSALDALSPLQADGLVKTDERSISVTEVGRYFLRNIAVQFDGYMTHSTQRMYSKAI